MKILVAPDKFKGSVTTFEVCESIGAGIKSTNTSVQLLQFPMADGGDGFAAVLKHYLQTTTIMVDTVDPLGRPLQAAYEWNEREKTAIIELAAASGLELLKQEERNPMFSSTYGTGLQVLDALDKGAEKIILGLGGSATNDAGLGVLNALGFRFLNAAGNTLKPVGKALLEITDLVLPEMLPQAVFEIACDVQNPLHGPNGAAFVYAPQKGATPADVIALDAGLKNIETVFERQSGRKVGMIPGTGAAGGIAAGLLPWLAVKLVSGIQLVLEVSNIKNELNDTDLIITGEGKLDTQSEQGKVVSCLAQLGKSRNIPVAALCGTVALPKSALHSMGLQYSVAILKEGMSLAYCMQHAKALLAKEAALLIGQLPEWAGSKLEL